jgi:hypothetical protein
MENGMRAKMATAGVGLTLVGNLLFGVMQRVEAIEGERHEFQVTVEHRLTAIETKLDELVRRSGDRRQTPEDSKIGR